MRAFICGVGTWVPETILSNADLEKMVDTNDEWIRTRTGIEERRILDRDLDWKSSDLGVKAAEKAMEDAGISPEEVDGIIAGSMYPDFQFPAMACILQAKLGCKNAFAYDITAACAFLPFAVNSAALYIESGQAKNILVIGAELASRVVDWTDRNTCILFGDGAGAFVLSATEDENRGILASAMKSDGSLGDILSLENVGADDAFIRMDGTAVFKTAVIEMVAITKTTLERAGLKKSDLDLLVPHQANERILVATARKLGVSQDQVIMNVNKYGNTSSASIPLALREAMDTDRIRRGDLVAMMAIGGGMSWGCNLMRW